VVAKLQIAIVSIDMEIDEVGAGMLCYQHAERVVVPRGWKLEDHRVIEPYLFDGAPYDVDEDDAPDDDAVVGEQPLTRKERKRRKLLRAEEAEAAGELDDEQLSLGKAYDLPEEYDSPEESDGVAADRSTSPLLARAFDMSRTRHKLETRSVTQPVAQPVNPIGE
jgi:hypothetical protein